MSVWRGGGWSGYLTLEALSECVEGRGGLG